MVESESRFQPNLLILVIILKLLHNVCIIFENDHDIVFFLQGHDTITSATSFIIYELAKHADIQEKVLQEIFDVVGIDCNEEIRLRQFKELNYLDRVVKEVMRIFPTVPLLEREVAEDITLGMVIFVT